MFWSTKETLKSAPWICHTCFSDIAVISKLKRSENYCSRELYVLAHAVFLAPQDISYISQDPCLSFSRYKRIFRRKTIQLRYQSKAISPLQLLPFFLSVHHIWHWDCTIMSLSPRKFQTWKFLEQNVNFAALCILYISLGGSNTKWYGKQE